MNLVVFTTILGPDTDRLRSIRRPNPDVHYICFTDQRVEAVGWDIIQVLPEAKPNIHSRRLKILAHQTLAPWQPDVSLWMDAAFELHCDPVPVMHKWLEGVEMVALRHPHRDNIKEEGAQIIKLGLADATLIERQIADARDAGFPVDAQAAITSTGFCFRRHTERVARFNECWWRLFTKAGHGRDQMSVDWALWECSVPLRYLEGHYRDNPYARWHSSLRYQKARRP